MESLDNRNRFKKYLVTLILPSVGWVLYLILIRTCGDVLDQFKWTRIISREHFDLFIFVLALFVSLKSARSTLNIWENGILTFLFIETCYLTVWLLLLSSEARPITIQAVWNALEASLVYSLPGACVLSLLCHVGYRILRAPGPHMDNRH